MKSPIITILTLAILLLAPAARGQGGPTTAFPLTVINYSHDYVTVSWGDFGIQPTSADWSLQQKVKGDWDTVTNRSFHLTDGRFRNLTEETTYEFRVVFNGVASHTLVFTTPPAFSGTVSAGPAGADDLADDLLVSWDLEPGAVGYVVRYRLVTEPSFVSVPFFTRVINSGSIASTTIADLVAGNTYYVEVHAQLPGAERTGWASPVDLAVLGFTPPENFNAARVAGAPVRLFFDQEPRADTFTIERSEDTPDNYQFLAEPFFNATQYTDSSADPQTRYYYRIRSNASDPVEISAWAYDDVWSSKPQPPGGVTATALSDSAVLVLWSEVPGVTDGYEVQRSVSPFTEYETIGFSGTDGFLDGLDEDNPISPGETYRYRVISLSGDTLLGDSVPSLTAQVTLPPAAPDPLTAVLATSSRINLSWPNVAGETGYTLERRIATLGGGFGAWIAFSTPGANVTSASDFGVSSGNRYQYRVRSGNAIGNSEWVTSNIIATSAGVPVNVQAVPGSGPGSNDCDDAITLTWDPVPGATGYVVRRSLTNGLDQVDFPLSGNGSTTFVDTGLDPYTVYWYRVQSVSAGGNSVFGVNVFELTCAFLGTSSSGSTVNLSWSSMASDFFSEYRIERRDLLGDFFFEEIATVSPGSTTSYADTSALPDSRYEYRIRGWKAADGGTFSRYSIISSENTGPPPVTGFIATPCNDAVHLQWDPAYSADTINILRRPNGGGTFSIIDSIDGALTTYIDTTAVNGTAYDYWIFVGNGDGENDGDMLLNIVPAMLPAPGPIPGLIIPLSITIQRIDAYSFEIEWGPVAGNQGYRIERRLEPDGDYEIIETVAQDVQTYTDSGLTPGTQYRYRVAAVDLCGETGLPVTAASFTYTILEAWRVGYWGSGTFPRNGSGVYNNQSDFDKDGVINLFEFFHDTDPTDPADFATAEIDFITSSFFPFETFLQISYPLRAGDLGGVTWSYEFSEDLDFTDPEPGTTVPSSGSAIGRSQIGSSSTGITTPRLFGRLKLTDPEN